MRMITVTGNDAIQIGRRGENQATQIVWTNIVENWRATYGEGVVQLAVRRPKDTTPYPVACEVIGNDVMWTIQAADTAQSGVGECELSYIVDAVLVKSQTWATMIARSLTGDETAEPPSEPAKTWFTKIQAEIGNLEDLETDGKSNLVAAINEVAQSGGVGTGGTSDHTKLKNRDADDQHPMSAITGLTDALAGKQPTGNYLTQADLQDATDKALAQAKAGGEFDGATGPAGPQGPAGVPGKDGAGMDITGASVGQIAKIATVDDSGKPTGWEAVDMPSGGGTSEVSWHEWDNVIVPEGGLNAFDFTTLESGEKLSDHRVKGMFIYSPSATSSGDTTEQSALLIVNGDYMFDLASFVRSTAGYLRLLLTVENGMLVVRYYKRDTDAGVTFNATKVTINNSQDLRYPSAISRDAVSVIGYGKTLKAFNQIQSVRIESNGQVAKSVEFDVQVLY